jgi:NAD+ dependent glucose-6-phosphate dehydrogenase
LTAAIARRQILVTGSSGVVGSIVTKDLARDHSVRGFDVAYPPGPLGGASPVDFICGSITEVASLADALHGVDAIVHLAAIGNPEAGWSQLFSANIVGTHNVFEAAIRAGVSRVVYASSSHASGIYTATGRRSSAANPPAPPNLYGVTKAFGEVLGHQYAHAHGLSVICLRIGWIQATDDRHTPPADVDSVTANMWISHRDTKQIVRRALDTDVHYGVFYAMSSGAASLWDISDATDRLGYHPLD